MSYLIGTDEAGYGPNLGPLVVSASVWEVPHGVQGKDLYGLLEHLIAATRSRASESSDARVVMADSKALYQSRKGLGDLERGVWAAMALLDRHPNTWREVWDALAPESSANRQAIPWYADYDSPVPLDAHPADLERLEPVLREGLAAAGVRLAELRSRAVFPGGFNRLMQRHGSKGAALSHITLQLAADLMAPLPDGPIAVLADKHGGRNRYQRLLSEHFPESLIEVHGESRARSVYRFGPGRRRIEFRFQAKAESYLPTALASMASKYLRELAMRALNDFWCRRVARLRPTAGYPVDAKRFKTQIAAVQEELGIDDGLLWRVK